MFAIIQVLFCIKHITKYDFVVYDEIIEQRVTSRMLLNALFVRHNSHT